MNRSSNILARLRKSSPVRALRRLAVDRSGLGAVEFAIVAPILLMLYITAFELTIGLSVAKRATRSAGSIADLVTQQKSVTKAYLATMADVADATFVPYPTKGLKIKISGIKMDATKRATIAWSWDQDGKRPYAVDDVAPVPSGLTEANSFLVHAEVSIEHQLLMFMPGLVPPQMRTINIGRDYYYRQRLNDSVPCGDC